MGEGVLVQITGHDYNVHSLIRGGLIHYNPHQGNYVQNKGLRERVLINEVS